MTDQTPEPDGGPPTSLFTSRRHERTMLRRRRLRIAGIVIVVLAVGGGGWWLWAAHSGGTPDNSLPVMATDSFPPPTPAAAPAAAPVSLPPLDASDDFVRKLVAGLSARPQFASWLVPGKLVHRFVVAVVDVANGRSPEDQLGFLAPKRPFRARQSGDSLVVDPASYRRYDALTATFVSLDSAGVGKLYHELSPLMEDAYQDLGIHGGSFQNDLARAFGRLLAVKFPDRPPTLVLNSVPYAYASPALESQSAAAKLLLRFGPDNGRRIQAKLRALATAMGVVPVAPA